jgi:hypothetical protein
MKTNKATAAQMVALKNELINGLSTIRKSGDRAMMRDAILRIRQIAGILEAKARVM